MLCRGKQRGCIGYFEDWCEQCPHYAPPLNPDWIDIFNETNRRLSCLDTTVLKFLSQYFKAHND